MTSTLTTSTKKSLIGMDLAELEQYVVSLGLEKFRAKQIYKWIYSKWVRDYEQMTDLSKKAKELLSEATSLPIGTLKLIAREISKDGTEKYLFETASGDKIESVLMYFGDLSEDDGRYSACISSQVGCAVGCPFCATGALGFKKNLTAEEIIEQVLFMQNINGHRISNIVYMGQGEPLNNYDAVIDSIDQMRNLVGIGVRHITVSTSGVVPKMDKLADEDLQITLALSLHDPTDEGRDYLVPINRKWPVAQVIQSMKDYVAKTNRRVTIEYVMLEDVNDSFEKAKALGNLVKGLHCNINLIPYNQTNVNDPFTRSNPRRIEEFSRVLEQYCAGKTITIRRERGHDIQAACGQLAGAFSINRS